MYHLPPGPKDRGVMLACSPTEPKFNLDCGFIIEIILNNLVLTNHRFVQ